MEEESQGNIDKYSQDYHTGYKEGYADATKAIINLINDFYKDDVKNWVEN